MKGLEFGVMVVGSRSIVPLFKSIDYGSGYTVIRAPYTSYSVYLTRIIILPSLRCVHLGSGQSVALGSIGTPRGWWSQVN